LLIPYNQVPESYTARLEKGLQYARNGDYKRAAEMFEWASQVSDIPGLALMHDRIKIVQLLDSRESVAMKQLATMPLRIFPQHEDYRAAVERDNMVWVATLTSIGNMSSRQVILARILYGEKSLSESKFHNYAAQVTKARQEFIDAIK